MYVSCSIPYTYVTNNDRPRCMGNIFLEQDITNTQNIASCSVPFTETNTIITCIGTFTNVTSSTTIDQDYILQVDTITEQNGYLRYPVNMTNELIEQQTSSDNQTLSAVEYGELITLALPSLIIAFTFNFLYRQIINRN